MKIAAEDLSRYVCGVYGQLFKNQEIIPIVHVGGVFQSNILQAEFKRNINSALGCAVAVPLFSPAAGALLEALRQDGNSSPLTGLLPLD